MRISVSNQGDFKHIERFLRRAENGEYLKTLERFGQRGVNALSAATPAGTGITASSWDYAIKRHRNTAELQFFNSNVNNGVNIAIILQYGHGTGTGGYVTGVDYINPVLRRIVEQLLVDIEKAVNE